MNRAFIQYQDNSKSIKELGLLYDLILTNFPLLNTQAEEILRAQFVLIVSALDTYIHDVVRVGMLKIYQDSRNSCSKTDDFPIEFSILRQIEQTMDKEDKLALLEKSIQNKNSKESYQSPKSIEYALGLVNIDKVWTRISTTINRPAEDIRNQLALIINRRNKIAHESDREFTTGEKCSIDKSLVDNTINFIDSLCSSIHGLLLKEYPGSILI
jgi:hypothetical protein